MPPSNILVDDKLLRDVASAVHSFTLAKPLEWLEQHSALVEYGIGRFVDGRDRITIEEPLVLLAICQYSRQCLNLVGLVDGFGNTGCMHV